MDTLDIDDTTFLGYSKIGTQRLNLPIEKHSIFMVFSVNYFSRKGYTL